jgi:hypothetical protein
LGDNDDIKISLQSLENGWLLSVFNNRTKSRDITDLYCGTIEIALKEIPKRIKLVREDKE